MNPVERGARTLRIEAEALSGLIERLDEGFIKAVDIVLGCKGKVAVTGMGKSGLIGQKISATLASTGTPSYFLHPAEGVHGDLGMVTKDDVIVALSYSGETDEVVRILPVFARMGTPLIAITGSENSTLWRAAQAVLNIHVKERSLPDSTRPHGEQHRLPGHGRCARDGRSGSKGVSAGGFRAFSPWRFAGEKAHSRERADGRGR